MTVAVVGSGLAGLWTALCTAAACPGEDIVVVTKGRPGEGNTALAQGGIAAVLAEGQDPGDSPDRHAADTLAAGAGHGSAEAVRLLCTAADGQIRNLIRAGARFDTGPDGAPALAREAAHSFRRILHMGGDATGAGIIAALLPAVRSQPNITVLPGTMAVRVLLDGGRAAGLDMLSGGARRRLAARAVVLAAGGAGQMYEHTTNPASATGDGVALAARAGARLRDLEFLQFHPTSLDVPGNPLISEAVRGEGAVLRDDAGLRFLPRYARDAELAPRDVVARGIAAHLAATGGRRVWLDATGAAALHGPGWLERRFPALAALTRGHGWDWEREPVPVVPAAHYWMGGVATDLSARTSVPGLYAAGETACTGVHGANRLASNSLLEALVFAARAAAALAAPVGQRAPAEEAAAEAVSGTRAGVAEPDGVPAPSGVPDAVPDAVPAPDVVRRLMSAHAGILRSGPGLSRARTAIAQAAAPEAADPAAHEAANLATCAALLLEAALARPGSLGAHHRTDDPAAAGSSVAGSWVAVAAEEVTAGKAPAEAAGAEEATRSLIP